MNMTQNELDEFNRQLRREMPNAGGETVVIGRLHSMGYHVRESIRRTDPLNTPLRRPYSVPALWHVGTLYQHVWCVYLYNICLSWPP